MTAPTFSVDGGGILGRLLRLRRGLLVSLASAEEQRAGAAAEGGPGQGLSQALNASMALAPATKRAAVAFEAALEAFQNGDFETARQRYEEAYRLAPHPNTLYNLALACERLLDYDAAIAAFKRFLGEPLLQDREAARLQETRRLLAERSLRRLSSMPARVSLSAVPDPVLAIVTPLAEEAGPGAKGAASEKNDKSTGDTSRCETPCIMTVPAGRYRLRMQRDGYFSEESEFEAHIGQALLISRQLRPRPRRIEIASQPRARLYLDDRLLGETPYAGDVALGNHRLRLERRFYLTEQHPLDVWPGPGKSPLRLRFGLELSGRVDMLIGGAVAGAGLGLMVLRLFLGEEIETLERQQIYKPLAAALLPAVLGASVAGFAGWEMPTSEAQLLIGSAGFGTMVGFGLGLGAQPQGPLPHVLAIGGGLVGGTVGTAVYRYLQPRSSMAAIFNSAALWGSLIGALGWAYLISENRPETAFYGQSSNGRSGEGGWIMFGSTLGGIGLGMGLGIGLAHLPLARDLSRGQVALVDLGGTVGGLVLGAVGMGAGYARTGSWKEAAQIAIPCTIAGIGAGLAGAAVLVHTYRRRLRARDLQPGATVTEKSVSATLFRSGPPQLSLGSDLGGGISIGLQVLDGSF